eukprot:TRINITY_DN12269_c0_g1_i2.p1 TRINITY_DN12269_c0_g1~~TRINITY_DN12269_c0_g1_i2.p1  ORF type:complete len:148 (+),score=18.50 TRINITY_DN12269_c0_g1_i2:61-504(+)
MSSAGETDTANQADDEFISGPHCTVRKHRYMGCAIVTVCSDAMVAAVIERCTGPDGRAVVALSDSVTATVSVSEDRGVHKADPAKFFVGWGCRQEKRTPVSASTVHEVCSGIIAEILREVPASSLAPTIVPDCSFGGSTTAEARAFQ